MIKRKTASVIQVWQIISQIINVLSKYYFTVKDLNRVPNG